jgi:hypothetical protein
MSSVLKMNSYVTPQNSRSELTTTLERRRAVTNLKPLHIAVNSDGIAPTETPQQPVSMNTTQALDKKYFTQSKLLI